jgi:hypothetical protein
MSRLDPSKRTAVQANNSNPVDKAEEPTDSDAIDGSLRTLKPVRDVISEKPSRDVGMDYGSAGIVDTWKGV